MTRASGRATKNAQRLHAARRVYFRKRGLVSVVVELVIPSQPALWLGLSIGMSGDSLLVCIPQENKLRLDKVVKILLLPILPSDAVLRCIVFGNTRQWERADDIFFDSVSDRN